MACTFSGIEYAVMVYIYWFAVRIHMLLPNTKDSFQIREFQIKEYSAISFRDCETADYFLAFLLQQNLSCEKLWLKKKTLFI
jgi:hypothetical protein